MNPKLHTLMADIFAVISASAALSTWQTQFDWTLRMLAALVAIVAGAITIWQKLKKKPVE